MNWPRDGHLPVARSIEKLLMDEEVRSALGKGAILASVPLILETGKLARAISRWMRACWPISMRLLATAVSHGPPFWPPRSGKR